MTLKARAVKKAAAQTARNVARKTRRAMQPVIKKAKRAAEDATDALKKKGRAVVKKALFASSRKLKRVAKAM